MIVQMLVGEDWEPAIMNDDGGAFEMTEYHAAIWVWWLALSDPHYRFRAYANAKAIIPE